MNEVESPTHAAAKVYTIPSLTPPPAADNAGQSRDHALSNSCIATAKETLSQALNMSGFVDIVAGIKANFSMLVSDRPDESVDMEDLKPGMTTELLAWAASKLQDNPQAAQGVQAHIDPRRAVSLLR